MSTLNSICSLSSQQEWHEDLSVIYRKRSIDLRNPGAYTTKDMDEFLKSEFTGITVSILRLYCISDME